MEDEGGNERFLAFRKRGGRRGRQDCRPLWRAPADLWRAFDSAAAFAGRLASLGLAPGDRVAIFMRNGLLYPAVLLGAFRGGYVAVPINAKLHPREASYIVENAAAKAIVVDSDALRISRRSPQTAAWRRSSLAIPPHKIFETVLLPGSANASRRRSARLRPGLAFYTSGTTGLPKGAVLSHRNLIAMAVNCLADICSFRPDDRLLHAAPLSHGSGMYFIPALSRGAENIIDAGGGFDPDRVLRFVVNERVTVLPFLAPTMIVRLLEADPAIQVPNYARSSMAAPRSISTPSRRAAAFRARAYPALRSRRVADDHLCPSSLGPRKRGRRNTAIRGLRPLGCGGPDPGRRRASSPGGPARSRCVETW